MTMPVLTEYSGKLQFIRRLFTPTGNLLRRHPVSDTINEVKAVIMDVMKIDGEGITMETRFVEDLKADSMDQFFLIDGFCEKFGMNINDDDARAIRTVADAVTYIDSHKN
jgi:acyl carrier protein